MGCSGSKEVGEEDRVAVKRNATIDRMIRNDKKYQDRTVKILLLGMDIHFPSMLLQMTPC